MKNAQQIKQSLFVVAGLWTVSVFASHCATTACPKCPDPTGQVTQKAQVTMSKKTTATQSKTEKSQPVGATPERDAIDTKYKWNPKHLFKSDTAWEKERKAVVEGFKEISDCKGKLKRGQKMVLTCLQRVFALRQRLSKLGNYAHRLHDQDARVTKYQGSKQVMDKVYTEFAETTSFLEPELLALPVKDLKAMIKHKDFADYNEYLKDIVRLKPHILGSDEEKLLASTSLMRDAGYDTYSTFSSADMRFPDVTDDDGNAAQLSQALFAKYRTSSKRAVRKEAFEKFFGTYEKYINTMASLLSAQVNANIVYAKARKYNSALEAALDSDNIPVDVYYNMIKAVNKHLPELHRYLALRQKLLRVKQLKYYDMYPSIVKKVEFEFSYEEAQALLSKALDPMGESYVAMLDKGLTPGSGWIDVYPNQGKRSGAYSAGSAYDVHPFILMNYLGDYNSVSTLAHEMGHAMHSYLSNQNQPFPKADYSIFVAEVASTLNEALLMHHMLGKTNDPKRRLFLLGQRMEDTRTTIFRQAMFAEFELAIYEHAEAKKPLTAESISKIYLDIVRRYYGHEKGVVEVDELYGMEWAYVPHFYYNFYVFQYVTGLTAATALAELIVQPDNGVKARDRYVTNMLKAGSSDYPIKLLQRAGVDLTSTEPYDIALGAFSRALGEAEAIVAAK